MMSIKSTDNLQLRVPSKLKRQLAMEAAEKGVTIRAIILQALSASGYSIASDEIRDKRKG